MDRPIFRSRTQVDDATRLVSQWFDISFSGESTFEGWSRPNVGTDFSIGLIVGPSGSGKSLLLRQFGDFTRHAWVNNSAIVSQFSSASDAIEKLMAVGFNDVRGYLKEYRVLSTGEQFRADLAIRLQSGAVVDEFTSTVDRVVAKAASTAIHRYVNRSRIKNLVFASCHYDILSWLRPDWYFDTADGILYSGRSLQRPIIQVRVYPCKRGVWKMFAPYHYLSHTLGSSARCFLATAEFEGVSQVVGFVASLPLPSGTLKKAWREHRTVVLPDFQGLGIGPRISDAVAKIHLSEGKRYYSRTAHPRFGSYRDQPNSGWIPTSKYKPGKGLGVNQAKKTLQRKTVGDNKKTLNMINEFGGDLRVCFSHEYIGEKITH